MPNRNDIVISEKHSLYDEVPRLELQPEQQPSETESYMQHSPHGPLRGLLVGCCVLIFGCLSLMTFHKSLWQYVTPACPGAHHQVPVSQVEDVSKIQLEAHIMSKCPDAKACLQQLVVPTMVQVSNKVNFTLSYIARIDPKSDAVSCMHGPGECLGNIIQLCAAHLYPDPKLYLGFANCMTTDYEHIPERDLVENCSLEHGLDFKTLNSCISEEGEGVDLLRTSVQRSQAANVTKSCTVRLAGKVRCIRDGGEWYDCPGGSDVSDLVAEIKKLYDEENK